jgi:hypothetical protein
VPATRGDFANLPASLNRFILRSIAFSLVHHEGAAYVVIKIARLMLFGVITPGRERALWRNTKLHAEGGSLSTRDCAFPAWVREHLAAGAETTADTLEGLSSRQKLITHDTLMDHALSRPEEFLKSGVAEALRADLKVFGNRAFGKSPSEEGND